MKHTNNIKNTRTFSALTVFLTVLLLLGTSTLFAQSSPSPSTRPTADFSVEPTQGCSPLTVYFTDLSTGYIDSWFWDFGDGTTSTEQNPSHVYTVGGTYDVSLTVANTHGSDTKTKASLIIIDPLPEVAFTASPNYGLAPLTVNFTDNSIDAHSWHWEFGDGNSSDIQNPTHIYADTGHFTVTLTAGNECAEASKSSLVVVGEESPPIEAEFMAEPTEGCVPLTVYFTDLSIGDINSWYWEFGDGTTSTNQNPTHVYTVTGVYTVSLTVTGPDGTDTEIKQSLITVETMPRAYFIASTYAGDAPLTVQFTDQSINSTSWYWDFGDGHDSYDQNPEHIYTDTGVFLVSLTVSNACGSNTKYRPITVTSGEEEPPVADFSAEPTEGCNPLTVYFTDLSTGNITSWLWDFGNGITSPDQNPTYVYTVSGNYTVTLTVTGPGGSDSETKTSFIIVKDGPTASFSSNPSGGYVPLTVNFTNNSTDADTWDWDFGDGTTSIELNPVHDYSDTGIYIVTLNVENECGNDQFYDTIYVERETYPCHADFSAEPTFGCEPLVVHFTDLSDCRITDWLWDFGDGTNSTLQNPQHNYPTSGDYTVSLTVTGPDGSDTETKTDYITVLTRPTADFVANPDSGDAPLTVQFNDRSTHATFYDWDFGDGDYSFDPSPRHTYATPGRYTVRLIVENYCGSDSKTWEIVVTDPNRPPVANFRAEPTEGCEPLKVYFTDLSTGHITSWFWTLGDGTTTTNPNPVHTYNRSGQYTITLSVSGPTGFDSETKTHYIIIHPGPTAGFDAIPDSGSAPLTVNFVDQSTYTDFYTYDFDDGDISHDPNPQHTFGIPGRYTVRQIVENPCGSDYDDKVIVVTPPVDPPIADFDADPPGVCGPTDVHFTDWSTGQITSWLWDFGDGTTSTTQHPAHNYLPGRYDVTLTVTGPGGSDSETKTSFVVLKGLPTAAFTPTPDSGNYPLVVAFGNQSKDADSYLWRFGDGDSSTTVSPSHTYQLPGDYTATLIATNVCGSDTTTQTIKVTGTIPPPIAKFDSEQSPFCDSAVVYFDNQSSGIITSWLWDFGDGNTSTTDWDPVHTYFTAGTYTVSLNVTGPGGADSTTKTLEIVVLTRPTAAFVAQPDSGQAPVDVQFTNLSINADSYIWHFGDGDSSTVENPSHRFDTRTSISRYEVKLEAINECGSSFAYDTIIVTQYNPFPGDVLLSMQVDKPTAPPNDILTYTLQVVNTTLGNVNNVVVHDTIPAILTYLGSAVTKIPSATIDTINNVVVWDIGTLIPGETQSMEFSARISASAQNRDTVLNRAVIVTPNLFDEASALTIVTAPEILLTKVANPVFTGPGDTVNYRVRVTNNGDYLLADAILEDDLPNEFEFVSGSATINGVSASVSGIDPIIIDIGNIAIGAVLRIDYQAAIPETTPINQTYINIATLYENNGAGRAWGPVQAEVTLARPPLTISKKSSAASAYPGDLLDFYIEVGNGSGQIAPNASIVDTLPFGFAYVNGSSTINGSPVGDPAGFNPVQWNLGNLAPGSTIRLRYTVQIGTRVQPGVNENIAWAHADFYRSARATADVNIVPDELPGSIRGRIVVDCDGDGILDSDIAPSGVTIFLDDGSRSKSNNQGMFYLSSVRPGSRVVKIDERDLVDYYLPEDQPSSKFVFVHEYAESYLLFRVCPKEPMLSLNKSAALIPKAMVTKRATIDTTLIYDSTGVKVDYEIEIEYSGGAKPINLTIVDSLPTGTKYSSGSTGDIVADKSGSLLTYNIPVATENLKRTASYSLLDLEPGTRRFLDNKIYIEGKDASAVGERTLISKPATVSVGAFRTSPPGDIEFNIVGAYFETSKDILRPEALPILNAIADSMEAYDDVTIRSEGHCDYRIIHTKRFPSNWELSEARALSVLNWLTKERGVDTTIMSYEGFAATRPVDSGHSEVHWQRNRRVEVFIKGNRKPQIDLSQLPVKNWEARTILELNPVEYDTLFSTSSRSITPLGDNSWEVKIEINNFGSLEATKILLTDMLPDGVEYTESSLIIDNVLVSAEINDRKLSVEFGPIISGQTVIMTYRIKAPQGANLSGGGSATIKVLEPESSMDHNSNEVRF